MSAVLHSKFVVSKGNTVVFLFFTSSTISCNILDVTKSQLNLALQILLITDLFAFADVFWLFEGKSEVTLR